MMFNPEFLETFQAPERVPKSIGSARLLLRQYHSQDADEFATLFAESFEGHLEPWSPPLVLERSEAAARRAARDHISTAIDKWEEGLDYRFFITLRETGIIVGQIGLSQVIRGVSQSSFIGYWIGKTFVNQGYATEAVVLAMEFAFEHLKLHRISLWIALGNVASLRIPEKLGLRFEGTAQRALFLGREWKDTHIFAMTLEEWTTRKQELRAKFAPEL
jgi:ribosomal-protein-alanine N-acetyltransferase